MIVSAVVVALTASALPVNQATASVPWNVVVIMVDDLDVGSLERAVSEQFMPNFYSLIYQNGIVFNNSFVSYALCCPSRATFLTGQYAHNHGVKNNTTLDNSPGCLAFDGRHEDNLATWLHDEATYYTGLVGKYLNGYGEAGAGTSDCSKRGWWPSGSWDAWHGLVHPEQEMDPDDVDNEYDINHNGSIEEGTRYQTRELAARADTVISDAAGTENPFFLLVTPTAPHTENGEDLCKDNYTTLDSAYRAPTITSPSTYERDADSFQLDTSAPFNENVSDKPWPVSAIPALQNDAQDPDEPDDIECTQDVWQDRLESLEVVDELIGTIGDSLEDNQVLSNTVVFFTSDNGFYHGEHRLHKKTFAYEAGIRVPLVVRYPGSSHREVNRVVLNTDLAPTIAQLAGIGTTS